MAASKIEFSRRPQNRRAEFTVLEPRFVSRALPQLGSDKLTACFTNNLLFTELVVSPLETSA
jgi:hypothetical protein